MAYFTSNTISKHLSKPEKNVADIMTFAVIGLWQLPPPLTDIQRDADKWIPMATNSETAFTLRPHMVINDIGEFFHRLIQG